MLGSYKKKTRSSAAAERPRDAYDVPFTRYNGTSKVGPQNPIRVNRKGSKEVSLGRHGSSVP